MFCRAQFKQWTRRCCYLVGLAFVTATLNLGLNGFMETGGEDHHPLYRAAQSSLTREDPVVNKGRPQVTEDSRVSPVGLTALTVPNIQTTSYSSSVNERITAGAIKRDTDVLCTTGDRQRSRAPIHLHRHRSLDKVDVRFWLKTAQRTALLAYEMDTRRTRGDYLAIALLNSAVVFTFDPGGGERVVLRSPRDRYNDEQWHRVQAALTKGRAQLVVDGVGVHTFLKGHASSVNSNSGLYLMSAPNQVRVALDIVSKQKTLLPPFNGCLRAVTVNNKNIDVTAYRREKTPVTSNQMATPLSPFRAEGSHSKIPHAVSQIASGPTAQLYPSIHTEYALVNHSQSRVSVISINGPTFRELGKRSVRRTDRENHSSMENAPILTAFSQNHFREAIDLIGSVQMHMPKKKIIVYDLGLNLHARNQLKTYCRVELRTYMFSRFPSHFRWLKACAWKPVIIKEVLTEFGSVIYCDASTRFQRDVFQLHALAHQTGVVARETLGPVTAYTHDLTFKAFGQRPDDFRRVKMAAAGILIFEGKPYILDRIITPWLECAYRQTCIAPAGLRYPPCQRGEHTYTYRCHRFDQSALNILLYLFLGNSRLSPALTTQLQNVTQNIRHATHLFKIHTC